MRRLLRTQLPRAILASLAMHMVSISAAALDSSKPPGSNFNLSHWYLTLPDAAASVITPAQLVTGYTNASWFYTGLDGAMVFWCPVDGGTTANSSYPRSELRERLDPTTNTVNWTGYGTHVLDGQCRVMQMPSSGRVIIGQIHSFTGNGNPLLKLVYKSGPFDAQFKMSPNSSTDAHLSFPAVALNALITYQIKMADGVVSVTVNGSTLSTNAFLSDPDWTNQTFYFKAGSYCQDNDGPGSEGARVAFYHLTAAHPIAAQREPLILRQAASQTVDLNTAVIFSITAAGAQPLSYQWRKDGVALPGLTNTYFAVKAQTNDEGNYSVVVTNVFGTATSAVARLTLLLSSSVPAPVSPRITIAHTNVALIWNALPGKLYRVFYKDILAETEWKVMRSGIDPTGAVVIIEDPMDGRRQRFYRVMEE